MFKRHQDFDCPHCARRTRFRKPPLDHGWHLLLTVLTAGLWSVGWLALIVHWVCILPWRCSACGRRRIEIPKETLHTISRYEQLTKRTPAW